MEPRPPEEYMQHGEVGPAIKSRIAEQEKADAQTEKAHEASLANVDRLHNRIYQQGRKQD
jgi:hypothetical protein